MSITTAVENVPTIGDDARDVPFFRITGRLFTVDRVCRTR